MRREVHDGLEDVFTPSPMDGVGPREKIYTEEHIMKRKNKIQGKAKSKRQRQRATTNKRKDLRVLPVTCVALARVRIKARFSSSDSADRTVFGSLRKRVNCGCTSELPKAVINRRAVLSTLEEET